MVISENLSFAGEYASEVARYWFISETCLYNHGGKYESELRSFNLYPFLKRGGDKKKRKQTKKI